MRSAPLFIATAALSAALFAGCEAQTPDTNTEVFQTIDEVAAQRRAQQMERWQNQTIEILKEDRPDIHAQVSDHFSVALESAGNRQVIPLAPIMELLTGQPQRSTAIIRNYLQQQLPGFDQQRLAKQSFDSIQPTLRPMLVSGEGLGDLNRQAGASLPATLIVPDLYWVPAAFHPNGLAATPVVPSAISFWNTSPLQVNAIALENLKSNIRDDTFETLPFGPAGKVGLLKLNADPAILLAPEFLRTVRKAWNSTDNLIVLIGSPTDVRFVESQNKKLLDMISPEWKATVEGQPHPLMRRPLLLSDQGLSLSDYTVPVSLRHASTVPTTRPNLNLRRPTSRPGALPKKPYITR